MTVSPTGDYYGLPTRVLYNQHLRLEYLAEAGPRIVRLSLADSDENLLAEIPNFKVNTAYGDYYFRGGHRLWHSPEASPRTYVPDDSGLTVEETPQGVRLTGPIELATGLRKSIEIQLHPDRSAVTLVHQLHSTNVWPIEFAPWAITQLRLGGIGVLPQPTGLGADPLLPNRRFALWPYARWQDPRLDLRDDFIVFHARPALPPFKVGYLNTHGWLGYWRAGVFFRKRFDPAGRRRISRLRLQRRALLQRRVRRTGNAWTATTTTARRDRLAHGDVGDPAGR